MEPRAIEYRGKAHFVAPVTLAAIFAAVAAVVIKGLGCPMAGCSNALISLGGGVFLALTLGIILSWKSPAERRRA